MEPEALLKYPIWTSFCRRVGYTCDRCSMQIQQLWLPRYDVCQKIETLSEKFVAYLRIWTTFWTIITLQYEQPFRDELSMDYESLSGILSICSPILLGTYQNKNSLETFVHYVDVNRPAVWCTVHHVSYMWKLSDCSCTGVQRHT